MTAPHIPKSLGRKRDDALRSFVNVRLEPTERETIEEIAQSQSVNLSDVVRHLIRGNLSLDELYDATVPRQRPATKQRLRSKRTASSSPTPNGRRRSGAIVVRVKEG